MAWLRYASVLTMASATASTAGDHLVAPADGVSSPIRLLVYHSSAAAGSYMVSIEEPRCVTVRDIATMLLPQLNARLALEQPPDEAEDATCIELHHSGMVLHHEATLAECGLTDLSSLKLQLVEYVTNATASM